jgi:hypothetical protein
MSEIKKEIYTKSIQVGTFTVIYSCDQSLQLFHKVCQFPVCSVDKRISIPGSFKLGKTIIAVLASQQCTGVELTRRPRLFIGQGRIRTGFVDL